jgi:hypothetical protein
VEGDPSDAPATTAARSEPQGAAPSSPASDPVEQWLDWETRANLPGFRLSAQPFDLELASVPRAAVDVRIPCGTPDAITARFVRGERVLVPKHPLNRDMSVAFFTDPCVERWRARYTSSRTIAVPGDPLFSVKLPTDRPHPDFVQPEKVRVREEALDALRWIELLDRADALLPSDPALIVLREALVVLVPGTESAFVVRDLRPLQSGRYYLPGLSIPWAGHAIARRHDEEFGSFWERHYAAATGRAKAVLFARTGLQLGTPNPQNLIVELDRELLPTGRIALRDIGDADCATDALACTGMWTRLLTELKPEHRNSFWAFDEAGDHSVAAATLARWIDAHQRAYYATLARYFPAHADGAGGLDAERALAHWSAALRAAR